MFGLVAILAQAQAVVTAGPWFDPEITEAFYGVTLVSAVLMTAGMGFWAAHRRSVLDDRVRAIDMRLAILAATPKPGEVEVSLTGPRGDSRPAPGPTDAPALATAAGILQEAEVPLVSLESTLQGVGSESAVQVETQELKSIQTQWRAQRDSVWPWVTGPISVSILYAIIAGTLLPGAAGFLVTNFRLNTTLILFIGYTWWLLLGWLVVALASHSRETKQPKPGPSGS